MILIKKDKKTGKTYRIVVPDWDVPIPVNNPIAPNGVGLDVAISSHSGSIVGG